MQTQHTRELFHKICMLSPEKVAVVEDFVEFLRAREEENDLIRWVGRLSAQSFTKVWDNPEAQALLDKKGMPVDSPILVRVFKEESELEVWKQDKSGQYALLKTYPICRWIWRRA